MVLLRNVIGVKTVGTFLPVLVALAFRETRLVVGLILFLSVVAVGVGLRFFMDRLRLLMVPRLAAVLVIVVLCLLGISILSHRLGLEMGLSVALFPIVILTIAIERVSILWEEVGPREALHQSLGTLLVAAVAYLIMGLDYRRVSGFRVSRAPACGAGRDSHPGSLHRLPTPRARPLPRSG